VQSEIQESAYEYQRQVERQERIIVGVNRFQTEQPEPAPAILVVDPAIRQQQCARLQALRARRDHVRCSTLLQGLELAAAKDNANLLPLIVEAVEAYCTLGEISDAFRHVWGEARDFGRAYLALAALDYHHQRRVSSAKVVKSSPGGKSVAVQIRKLSSD